MSGEKLSPSSSTLADTSTDTRADALRIAYDCFADIRADVLRLLDGCFAALGRVLRRVRRACACSIVCGSFATRSDDAPAHPKPSETAKAKGRSPQTVKRQTAVERQLTATSPHKAATASGRRKRRKAVGMLGISGGEFLVLLVVGALVLGPKNIAEALRAMRKGVDALRQWSAGMRAGADGEFGVAEKEIAALANLDIRQLDPRRIVREAVRDEMEAWMSMAGPGGAGAGALSSEEGVEPARDRTNRASRTAERATYSSAAFARAGSKGVGSKGAKAAATGTHAPQGQAANARQGPDAHGPQEPAANARQGPNAHAPQRSVAQAGPEPNEKSPSGPSAAQDSIEGDKL